MAIKENFPNFLWFLLLQDVPESLCFSLAAFSLLNLKLKDRRVLVVAGLQALTNLVRLLPIGFGVHSILLVLSLALYTHLFTRRPFSHTLLAAIFCMALVAVTEAISLPILFKLTGLEYQQVFWDPKLRALFSLPDFAALLGVALGKDYYNRKRGLVS